MGSQVETQIQDCLYWTVMDTTCTSKTRPQEKTSSMQHKGHNTQTIHWVLEHWHAIWQSWEVHQPPWQLTNHHAQQLKMNTLLNVNSHLYITCTHLLYSILYLVTLFNAAAKQETWESILFQPVLKAYPTHHAWIITCPHIPRKSGEKMEDVFVQQMGRTHHDYWIPYNRNLWLQLIYSQHCRQN